MKINIPSSEIITPDLHADELGYVFIWRGHLLRGIFPQSVDRVKEYFSSGFLGEIVEKRLFPKTWISDFENEQFGVILEHELIKPTLYALEWNRLMLRDAALLVLEIAEVAKKYDYNMIDCHKLNVLFRDNQPIYIDLGSFVKNQLGCSGWKPYISFYKSYYNILDLWTMGNAQIAKRMMSPGVELELKEYYVAKYPFFRRMSFCLDLMLNLKESISLFSGASYNQVDTRISKNTYLVRLIVRFLKKSLNKCCWFECQYNFKSLKRKISRVKLQNLSKQQVYYNFDDFYQEIDKMRNAPTSATIINCPSIYFYEELLKTTSIKSIISIQEDQHRSEVEYEYLKKKHLPITTTCFSLSNGIIITRHKVSEDRLNSNIVIMPECSQISSHFFKHNQNVLLSFAVNYSNSGIILLKNGIHEQIK